LKEPIVETEVFQSTAQRIQPTETIANAQRINELLGDSDEFALLRETLWIYSQIVDCE
jgi:hypothetical protein